jgi:thymidylate kinase
VPPKGTRLILVEGIPGSGKSSTAQWLARRLPGARWWYEEALGHPVYAFRDGDELGGFVRELLAGRHAPLVDAALAQWRRFVEATAAGDEVVLVDGCLYGYLTWSLFPQDLPEPEIAAYVAAVEAILRPLDPRLLYLRRPDVAGTLEALTAARGQAMRRAYVERSTGAPYSRRRGYDGFDGMVAFWRDYQAFTDRLFDASPLTRLRVDDGDWASRHGRIGEWLDLPALAEPSIDPARYVGRYGDARVVLEGGDLLAIDLPGQWPRVRLVPLGADAFDLESLPHRLVIGHEAARLECAALLFSPAATHVLPRWPA